MVRTRTVVLVSLTTAGLAVSGACSSSGGSGSPAPVPRATGEVVSAQSTSLGTILVDGKGRTVYEFANDKHGESTCEQTCAADWPPVPAPAELSSALPGVTGALDTATRADGSQQLTVAGHPLYTFSGDSAAGQTNGQGITLNGGLWTVVLPSGAPDRNPAGAATAAPGPRY
jgi:predicted lipoprotein with Yx(FWY)xxD motif